MADKSQSFNRDQEDSEEVVQDPRTLRSSLGTSRVEEDDFVINDIALRIPPMQIHIDKQSFNLEWKTLRTRNSQKSKSGYGSIRVSIEVYFNGNEDINYRLRPLVAGLRATPFCTVHNKYLENAIGSILNEGFQATKTNFDNFKSLALAMTSMTFSTVPGKPATLVGYFDFTYFNYFPYMPSFIYKSGDGLDKPGYAWDSVLWKKFYEPFMGSTSPVAWPRIGQDDSKLLYRQFRMVPNGSASATKDAADLADIIKNKPEAFFKAWFFVLSDPSINPTDYGDLLDVVHGQLVRDGTASFDFLRNKDKVTKSGDITAAGKDILYPLLEKYSKNISAGLLTAKQVGQDPNIRSELEKAKTDLIHRMKTLQSANPERLNSVEINTNEWTQIQDVNAVVGDGTTKTSIGGFRLFAKTNIVKLNTEESIIDQMSITFRNTLAVLPMGGYRYPTCQHIGSVDADLTFSINASNNMSGQIHRHYDAIESSALRFRQIPQGFNNIIIQNDFLKLFGISEFITKDISSDTIPGMPGRTRLTLTLVEAGITSKTRLRDGEKFTQEFTVTDGAMQKEIWKVLNRYLTPLNIRLEKVITPFTTTETLTKAFKLKTINISRDNRANLLASLVDEARDNYNDFLTKAMNKIFQGGFTDETRNRITSIAGISPKKLIDNVAYRPSQSILLDRILRLKEDSDLGFLPGIQRLQEAVKRRLASGVHSDAKLQVGKTNTNESLTTRQDSLKTAERFGIKKKDLGEVTDQNTFDTERALADRGYNASGYKVGYGAQLVELGVRDYQSKMADLLLRIKEQYLHLPEFSHLVALKEKLGLDVGEPAYSDFRDSLTSIANFVDPSNKVDKDTALIKYDPDCYLWYPFYQGGAASTLENLVGPEVIAASKKLSTDSFDKAEGAVDDFFQGTYRTLLSKGSWQAPAKVLADELDKEDKAFPRVTSRGKYFKANVSEAGLGATITTQGITTSFYKNASYQNSLKQETINKTVNVDIGSKVPINSHLSNPDQQKPLLSCKSELNHSTDINVLWGGVAGGTGSAVQQPQSIAPNSKKETSPNTRPPSGGKNTWQYSGHLGPKGINVDWSSKQRSTQAPNQHGYIAPMDGGFDLRQGVVPREITGTKNESRQNFQSRKRSVFRDYQNGAAIFIQKGFSNPKDIEANLKKNLKDITYDEYQSWRRQTGGKIGYLHKGQDMYAPIGTTVYAIADGIVKNIVGGIPNAGNYIEIYHPQGMIKYSRYLHLEAKPPNMVPGKKVTRGDVIAVAGNTGNAGGSGHLHFECWDKHYADPSAKVLEPRIYCPLDRQTGRPARAQRFSLNPSSPAGKRQEKKTNQYVPTDVTTTVTSPLNLAIQEFEKELYRGQAQSLLRAYPAFKLYFIEDDSSERKRLAYDDFFSYNAVKSIRVIRSRKIAADLCVIELTNVSGILSARKFKHHEGPSRGDGRESSEKYSKMVANTNKENPIASLLLQEGMHLHLRLGYCNDPDRLETVFNGVIMEVEFSESEDLVVLTAQSYAVELVQNIKGLQKPKTLTSHGLVGWDWWGFEGEASTARIIEEMLAEPEVLHFGRWQPGPDAGFGVNKARDILTNKWQFVPNPADDNIFAPATSMDMGDGIFFQKMKYIIYQTTIWDIIKELELRHPNLIASVVPYKGQYGERMTVFFGLPNQLYFNRDPSNEESKALDKIQSEQDALLAKMAGNKGEQFIPNNNFSGTTKDIVNQAHKEAFKQGKNFLSKILTGNDQTANAITIGGRQKLLEHGSNQRQLAGLPDPVTITGNFFRELKLREAKKAGYISTFRKYHLVTSNHHIISNNIRASSMGVANTINLTFPVGDTQVNESGQVTVNGAQGQFTLKQDSAIPDEEMRVLNTKFINVTNETLAKRYALSLLARSLKEIYKGELTIIGNPSIKPYDICYIFDEYNDMVGPIEVEQVTHTFSQETGFVTEIVPDMVVAVSEWSLLSTMQAMGIVMEGLLRTKSETSKDSGMLATNEGSGTFSPYPWMIGAGLTMFGGFTSQKIINFTQLACPIIMSPLMHHGKIMSAGISTRKMKASVWNQMFGDWSAEYDVGFDDWLDDQKDGVLNWLKKYTGGYASGSGSWWDRKNTVPQ